MNTRLVPAALIACAILATSLAPAKIIEVAPSSKTLAAESKDAHDARMAWWRDARFGMFIHWGLYSVAAGEWNGAKTKGAGEWIMNDLRIPPQEYPRLLGQFNPTNFDAAAWVKLAKDAGMKYIVITTKHHDGFCLFDSKFSDYDVMATPFRRDIMRELSDAARAQGIKIGWYHSILDWHDPDAQRFETFGTYEWRLRAQVGELLNNYGDIGVMWFDGEWVEPWNDERGKNLYTLCRTLQTNTIVNNRVGKHRGGMGGFTKTGGFAGDYATPEQQVPETVPPNLDWETCMTMNDTWGFKTDDTRWKAATTLIRHLIDIASKNGNFLLNVGPTGRGDIPDASIERLAHVGKWMKRNGEAIHGTTGSPFDFKLPFGRCTQRPSDAVQGRSGKLYLHVMDWPADRTIKVPVSNAAAKAYLLAEPNPPLEFERTPAGVVIKLPDQMPDADATVVALEIEGPPSVVRPEAPKPAAATTTTATTEPTVKAAPTTTTTTTTTTTKATQP